MLRVTVEMIPGGYMSQKRTIRELDIINKTTTSLVGNPQTYKVQSKDTYIGTVLGWDRERPVEELVCAALKLLRDNPLRDYD